MLNPSPHVSISLRELAHDLVAAGVELFAAQEGELQIAERVRMHLMDSGVRVRLSAGTPEIFFAATAPRSSFPESEPAEVVERVRSTLGRAALSRGYRELRAVTIEARDPLDASRVFEVFHGVEYGLQVQDRGRLVEEVRWALELERSLAAG